MNSRTKALLISAFLLTGAINTLTKKFQFQTCSWSDDSATHPLQLASVPIERAASLQSSGPCPVGQKEFQKPWSQNLIMFIGEAFVYLVYMSRRVSMRKIGEPDAELAAPLQSNTDTRPKTVPFYIFLVPAACDVLGTGLGGVGMLYISASVWQMMRGSLIIFSSLLSVFCLKRKLHCYNWCAVCTSCCGLILVGYSAVLDSGGDSSNILLGISFTVLSQFFAASQMVCEELFVKSYKVSPEQCVGSEGIWGIMIMVVVLVTMFTIPGKDAGSYENFVDSWQMIANSGMLAGLVFLYLTSISMFNFLGVTISGKLSTVTRTINDALRTAIVWGVQLLLFYLGSSIYGQGPTPHSWMQLLGFVFLVMGSLINHMVVKLPCLTYPGAEQFRKFRPMGITMSPGSQAVSVMSAHGSPMASPVSSPMTSARISISAQILYTDGDEAKDEGDIVLVEEPSQAR